MLKNITLSADKDLIEAARRIAQSENKTLNMVFREWLEQYRSREMSAAKYQEVMKSLKHVTSGRCFSRDELNER